MWKLQGRKRNGKFVSTGESSGRKNKRFFGSPERNDENINTEMISDSSLPGTSETPVKACNDQPWRSGRRIIELGHVADQMKCTDCKSPLMFQNIGSETRRGFGSMLYIECHECGTINTVTTNKSHRVGKCGPEVFDVNTKAAIGKCFISMTLILILKL